MKLKISFGIMSLSLVASCSTALAAPSTPVVTPNTQSTQADLFIPLETVNSIYKTKGFEQVTASEVPTLEEVNKALQMINVSNRNPKQVIDLGHGHQIVVEGGKTQKDRYGHVNPLSISPDYVYNDTAYGKISYVVAGVTYYTLEASNDYTYDNNTTEILIYQDPSSASASAMIGWTSEITSNKVLNIDPSVKDAIVDSKYTYLKYGNSRSGHMELRFTGAGNWYTKNNSFN